MLPFDLKTSLQNNYDEAMKAGNKSLAKALLLKAYQFNIVINLDNVSKDQVGDLFMFDYN